MNPKDLLRSKTITVYNFLLSKRGNRWTIADTDTLQGLLHDEPLPYSLETEGELLEQLSPQKYGWGERSESPTLEWVAAVLASYLLYREINVGLLIRFLKAINYFGLFSLFDIYKNILPDNFSTRDRFDYFKALAKHYKGKGELKEAQKYYRKAIVVAREDGGQHLFPYSLVLLAKLYSDYWQRKGLQLAFNKIAYERVKTEIRPNIKIPRWLQICADCYAKELYEETPKESEKVFRRLLRNDYEMKDTYNRVLFRYLECRIIQSIHLKDYKKLTADIKLYENILEAIVDNPKAKYIRTIQLLRFYRKLEGSIKTDKPLTPHLEKRINELKYEQAILLLDKAIITAKGFNDGKFFALAYYEKSYWLQSVSNNESATLDARIRCLEESYSFLANFDKSSINNRTYINVVQQLAKLYVQKKKWDHALSCYHTLYDYLRFLTETLDEDRRTIEKFMSGNSLAERSDYPEFNYLTGKELSQVKQSLLRDYKELTSRLIWYGENIRSIQRQHFSYFAELFMQHSNLITHDITSNMNSIAHALREVSYQNSPLEQAETIKETMMLTGNEIRKAIQNIKKYETLAVDEIMTPREIDIIKEIGEYVLFTAEHSGPNFDIKTGPVILKKHENKESIKVILRSFWFDRLLVNLVENASQVGRWNKIEKIQIEIDVEMVEDSIFLLFTDNCQDYDTYNEVINSLNKKETVKSKKNPDGRGRGLFKIKHMFGVEIDWLLIKLENGDRKRVKIPLTESGKING